MHINGGLTLAKAGSLALRCTSNLTVARNTPVPVTWGARDGNYDAQRYSHNLGNFTVTVNETGTYKITFNLNVRMQGSTVSTASRTDTVVAFLAINNQTLTRSTVYAGPYQQSGGYVTLTGVIDNIQMNAGNFVVLYLYRLVTTGTITARANEMTMSIEMVTKG